MNLALLSVHLLITKEPQGINCDSVCSVSGTNQVLKKW